MVEEEVSNFCYLITIDAKSQSFLMTIKLPESVSVINASATINLIALKKKISINTIETVDKTGDYTLLRFNSKTAIDVSVNTHVAFEGKLHLSDGMELLFSCEGNSSSKNFTGCATPPSPEIDKAKTTKGKGGKEQIEGKETDDTTEEQSNETNFTEAPMYGVNNLGFGVFRKVEQEVCCYVPGEVSHIENIMAKEYKERHTRNLTKTEYKEEETEEVEAEQKSDTATSSRNELGKEISNVLNRSTNYNVGASLGVGASWGGGSFYVNAGATFGFSSSNSSTNSTNEAQNFAQEVTESALERVVQKVAQKRTSKVIQEFEENNRHGFDNRLGDKHVTGVYRWIDIIYKNRLVSYDNRLMLEFLIPEPARLYKWAIEQELEKTGSSANGAELSEPTTLENNNITGPESISRSNYEQYGRLYGLTNLPAPQPEIEVINTPIELDWRDDPTVTREISTREEEYNFSLQVTPQYRLTRMDISIEFEYHYRRPSELGTYFDLDMGDFSYLANSATTDNNNAPNDTKLSYSGRIGNTNTKIVNRSHVFDESWSGSIPIEVGVKNIHDFKINITTTEEVDQSIEDLWKEDIYYLLLDAYNTQKSEYDALMAQEVEASEEAEKEKAARNPAFNRSLESREIQRAAIEMLTQDFSISMGENDFYGTDVCDVPIISQTDVWEEYSSHVKFFEQAFDWKIMDYTFYPYYWAKKCSWAELIQTKDSADPIFEAFLQSGMARVIVPVRIGFEEAVNLYLETGDIWNGGDLVVDTDDDLYLSIADELAEVPGVIGEEWQTRVPTSLTVIQSESVALEQSGLPCCDQINDEALGLLTSKQKLGITPEEN